MSKLPFRIDTRRCDIRIGSRLHARSLGGSSPKQRLISRCLTIGPMQADPTRSRIATSIYISEPEPSFHGIVLNDGKGWPETVSIMGRIDDQDLGTLGVEIMLPAAPWNFCERLLVELGDVLGANYSAVLPPEALGLCATQFNTYWAPHDSTLIQRGIPRLDLFTYGGAEDIVQPMYLGWLNYWSEATCSFVGFSGSKEDLGLAPFSYQTPGEAWFVAGPQRTDRRLLPRARGCACRRLPPMAEGRQEDGC